MHSSALQVHLREFAKHRLRDTSLMQAKMGCSLSHASRVKATSSAPSFSPPASPGGMSLDRPSRALAFRPSLHPKPPCGLVPWAPFGLGPGFPCSLRLCRFTFVPLQSIGSGTLRSCRRKWDSTELQDQDSESSGELVLTLGPVLINADRVNTRDQEPRTKIPGRVLGRILVPRPGPVLINTDRVN